MRRLTDGLAMTLKALACCTAPWDARSRSNRILLGRLERMGFAERKRGYPVGWIITKAGRSTLRALEAQEEAARRALQEERG